MDTLEAFSDGAISKKKVLNGEGPVDIEGGDERVVKAALNEAKVGRNFKGKGGMMGGDPNFVGVRLSPDVNMKIERVYCD